MTLNPGKEAGVKVRQVARKSPFYAAGLRRGDRILSIFGFRRYEIGGNLFLR